MDLKRKCLLEERREFLALGLKGGGAALLAVLPPSILFAGCGHSVGSNVPPAIAVPNSPSNVYSLTFSQFSALQNPGGTVHLSVAATSGTRDIYVTRLSTSSAIAVSTVCTHAGCTLNAYDPGAEQYDCPCHGSVFSATGSVVVGPATTPLQSYSGSIEADGIDFTIP